MQSNFSVLVKLAFQFSRTDQGLRQLQTINRVKNPQSVCLGSFEECNQGQADAA